MSMFAMPISQYELGVSTESKQVTECVLQVRNHASETISFGWRNALMQELIELQMRNDKPGWDGYDALPITKETVMAGIVFLMGLPDCVAIPDIVPEATGEVGFFWEKDEGKQFSISIGVSSLVFAGLIGPKKIHGEMKFLTNTLPENLEQILLDYFTIS
jgi:hypothetical protein